MKNFIEGYILLARHSECLKRDEDHLNHALANLDKIKQLLQEKEKEFCTSDQNLRTRNPHNIKDSLRKRCFGLIDQLLHYKCTIECLSEEIFLLESSIINDDELISLTLVLREASIDMLKAIRTNKERNESFSEMHYEEAQRHQSSIELQWKAEHDKRRKLIDSLISDLFKILTDKLSNNLKRQQEILRQRYQTINHLIKESYAGNMSILS